MVIGSNNSLKRHTVGAPVTTSFLEQYYYHLNNLKKVFDNNRTDPCCYNTSYRAVGRMKEFILKSGGLRAVELLSEYETSASIGDYSKCRKLEDRILSECKVFKDCWISMYN